MSITMITRIHLKGVKREKLTKTDNNNRDKDKS